MNKILELVEAHRLFSFNPNKYEIIVHPQSLIHAIVIFKNGQIKFLYHDTDMKIPISNAIYNNKINIDKIIKNNNNFIGKLKNIEFEKVDKRFPIVTLNKDKYLSKSAPIILNASNEILVESFVKNKIPYNGIYETLKRVFKDRDFNKYAVKKVPNINEIYKIDNWARKKTLEIISKNYEKILKVFYIVLLFSISLASPLKAEKLNKIVISGNERISDETLIVYGEIEKNKDYTQEEINNIIKNLYDTKFFSKISINFSNGILNISVEENPIINSITLQGEPTKKFTKALLNFMTLKEKSSFIKNDVKKDIEIIKEFYNQLGYYSSQVEARTVEVKGGNNLLI